MMKQFTRLGITGILFWALGLFWNCSDRVAAQQYGGPPVAKARPNILFIAVDDLNDWIGCMGGHVQARTPNVDRLAASGMLFTNAHCAATVRPRPAIPRARPS